jgi:hypothetical protein
MMRSEVEWPTRAICPDTWCKLPGVRKGSLLRDTGAGTTLSGDGSLH